MLPSPWWSPVETALLRDPGFLETSVERSVKMPFEYTAHSFEPLLHWNILFLQGLILGNSQKSFGCTFGRQGKLECYRIAAGEI